MQLYFLDVPSLVCKPLTPDSVTIHEDEITRRVHAIAQSKGLALPLVCYSAGYDQSAQEFKFFVVDEYNNILNLLAYQRLYEADQKAYELVNAWLCEHEVEAEAVLLQYEIASEKLH